MGGFVSDAERRSSTSARPACSRTLRRTDQQCRDYSVLLDSTVTYLTLDPLQAPNDLAVRAPDGTIFFTDPGPFPRPDPTIATAVGLDRRPRRRGERRLLVREQHSRST